MENVQFGEKGATEKLNGVHKEISRLRRDLICIGIERMLPLGHQHAQRKFHLVKKIIRILFFSLLEGNFKQRMQQIVLG